MLKQLLSHYKLFAVSHLIITNTFYLLVEILYAHSLYYLLTIQEILKWFLSDGMLG